VSEGGVVIAPVQCVSFDLTELAQLATYVRDKTRCEQETNIKTVFV